MSTNAPNRAGAIVPAQGGGALAVKADTALARARAVLKTGTRPAPVPESLRASITCTRTGTTSLGIFTRDGDRLVLVAHAKLPVARGGDTPNAAPGAGLVASIEFPAGWICPGCGSPHSGSAWLCDCKNFSGALHSCGDDRRAGVCFCGRVEVHHFGGPAGGELRGTASTPHATLRSRAASARLPGENRLLLPGPKK